MFVFWDGEETRDSGYCLFGASVGGARPVPPDMDNSETATYLQGPYLRTADMLDLLLSVASANPGAYHTGFNFDYDVNQILRELQWRDLIVLRHKGKVTWRGYRIEHIPGKIFKVSRDGQSVRVDDCFSFFRCRYDKALRKWEIGNEHILQKISDGKDSRDNFYYHDIKSIREYWAKEVQLGCHLMEKVKSVSWGAGYQVQNWHGPGALAAYSLKSHGVPSLMASTPPGLMPYVLAAYAGGWFERFKMGRHDGSVYTYDINSAYVYAMSLLPSLAKGSWRHVQFADRSHAAMAVRDPGNAFGVFHYKWSAGLGAYLAACRGVPFPLFHREANGAIRRPVRSEGWLWGPEAAELSAIPFAELTEAWIYDHDISAKPFAWVEADFHARLEMQALGDPSEKIIKWALASYYGRLAQRTGWNEETKEAPKLHQIEWAGWITSKCRSMIYRAAAQSSKSNGLVSIDTDGIISTVPISDLETGFGNGLGQWKEEQYSELIYLQNGVYWLRNTDGTWEEPKLRGIPKRKINDPELAIKALESGEPVSFSRRGFVGYRQALQGQRAEWRTWGDQPVSVDFLNCGGRVHVARLCRACMHRQSFADALHDLAPVPGKDPVSAPHRLPWLESQEESEKRYRLLLADEM